MTCFLWVLAAVVQAIATYVAAKAVSDWLFFRDVRWWIEVERRRQGKFEDEE